MICEYYNPFVEMGHVTKIHKRQLDIVHTIALSAFSETIYLFIVASNQITPLLINNLCRCADQYLPNQLLSIAAILKGKNRRQLLQLRDTILNCKCANKSMLALALAAWCYNIENDPKVVAKLCELEHAGAIYTYIRWLKNNMKEIPDKVVDALVRCKGEQAVTNRLSYFMDIGKHPKIVKAIRQDMEQIEKELHNKLNIEKGGWNESYSGVV